MNARSEGDETPLWLDGGRVPGGTDACQEARTRARAIARTPFLLGGWRQARWYDAERRAAGSGTSSRVAEEM